MFNSYVKLPEGMLKHAANDDQNPHGVRLSNPHGFENRRVPQSHGLEPQFPYVWFDIPYFQTLPHLLIWIPSGNLT
jgi:hypothetical protein